MSDIINLWEELIGTVLPYVGSAAPNGWLLCSGQAISRTTYANLYGVIGTSFGAGDGSTTFNLPDLRGEFMRGLDNGRGVDAGRTLGSFQADSFASHSHVLGAGANDLQTSGTPNANDVGRTEGGASGYSTLATGGTETRPRNVAMNFIIRY